MCVGGGAMRDSSFYCFFVVCIRQVCVCVWGGGDYKRFINLVFLRGLYKAGMCACVWG